jgi:penicillin-binding protein 2D
MGGLASASPFARKRARRVNRRHPVERELTMPFGAVIIRRIRIAWYATLAVAATLLLGVIGLFFIVMIDLPRVPEPLSRIIETPPTEIYAATGERIMILGGREIIPLNRVSPYFIHAVLATEDHRFWEHHGIDKLRTLKALWITLFKPGKVQGASTITQQLAKNLFFSPKRSYMRKFQEMLVSFQIEAQFSKRDILEAYINQIPFGVGAYGIEKAARTFFGKPAIDLTLAESALLAGLPKSPTRYNPYRHYRRAKMRQRIVLSRMVAAGYLARTNVDRAAADPLNLSVRPAGARTGSYFIDMVIQRLEESYDTYVVYHGGLKVTTTLNPQFQAWAMASVQEGLASLDHMIGISGTDDEFRGVRPQGALVAVETHSGAVKAVVGGRDYLETEFNRAVQNYRLPGSGFKPFVYYTAFEKLGIHPATVVVDKPITIPVTGAADWEPSNFERTHAGPMVLKQALMKSVNTIAAQLIEKTRPKPVIDTARRCGIKSPLTPVYSLAMGTSGVSPLEMATAFSTFATGGVYHEPFWIWRVEDAYGRVLDEHIVSGEKRLDARLTYQIVDMMRGVVDQGTGAIVRRKGFGLPAAGKTGTTNDYKDAWFTGFTPTLCVSVWTGYDRGRGLRHTNGVGITGGRAAAPIWANFMTKATQGEPSREFPIPPDIRFERVDPTNGRLADTTTINPLRVALLKEQKIPENQEHAGARKPF